MVAPIWKLWPQYVLGLSTSNGSKAAPILLTTALFDRGVSVANLEKEELA